MPGLSIEEYIKQKRQEQRESQTAQGVAVSDAVYITAEEYAAKMHTTANTVRVQCRNGEIPGVIKRGKRWYIPAAPTHSEEEFSELLQENARLKATLDILRGILNQAEGGKVYG